MKKLSQKIEKNIKGVLLFTGFFCLIFLAPQLTLTAEAASTSTVRGAAWWGNSAGYLYFNCLDDESGDQLDIPGNLTYPPGFRFNSPKCSGNQHAVLINPDNNFVGQAWNYNKGFISFSGSASLPTNGRNILDEKCTNCKSSNNCWACFNEADKKIYGWARVDNTGEWIRLDSDFPIADSKPPLQLETCGEEPPIYTYSASNPISVNITPGDFFGVASSPDSGDLFFNCENDLSDDNCETRLYKVYISDLAIGSLSAPNFSYTEACGAGKSGLGATLNWCVKSGQQKAYEIVINMDTGSGSDFGPNPTPEQITGATCYIKNYSGLVDHYSIHANNDCLLAYNKNYYWWIRLYNEDDESTVWYQYFGNTLGDTDGNIDNNTKTFSTFKHKFPSPYFDWPTGAIFIGSSTEFISEGSVYYTDTPADDPKPCNSLACGYFWWSSDTLAEFSSTSTATTSIAFHDATSTTVSLQITDLATGYYCTKVSSIREINYDLPVWREVKAR